MSLSILNYSSQCTSKQSKKAIKIFRTPKRSEFTGVKNLFTLFFFPFREKQLGRQQLMYWGLSGKHKITGIHIISPEIFSQILNISYPSLSLKSLWRFVIKRIREKAKVVYQTLFWSDKNEIRSVSWIALPNTWQKSTQAELLILLSAKVLSNVIVTTLLYSIHEYIYRYTTICQPDLTDR